MSRQKLLMWSGLLAFLLLRVAPAESGFIEIIGLDPRSTAMGGAAAAVADTPSAWYYNPAGLAQIRGGWQELGLSQIALLRFQQRNPEDGVWLDSTVPTTYNIHFPGCDNYGLKDITIGMGGGATFGGGVFWDYDKGDFRYSAYETMTLINTFTPTIAYKVNSWLMIGAGVNVVALNKMTNRLKLGDGFFGDAVHAQVKEMLGLPPNQPNEGVDGLLDALGVNTVNGMDDGKLELWTDEEFPTGLQPTNAMDIDMRHVTYNLGILIQATDRLRLGVTYREETRFKYEGQVQVVFEQDAKNVVNNNPLLVALNGGPIQNESTRFDMTVVMPRMLVAGASYQLTDRLLLAGDFQWTNWSSAWDWQITYLEGDGILGIKELAARRDFTDTYSGRVGLEYQIWKGLRGQLGYWYDPTPIPKTTLDSSTFDADRHVVSWGLGYWGLFNGLLDFSTVFQYVYFQPRSIAVGQSVNLGGMKNYESAVNDFPIDFKGYVFNIGFTFGLHY